MNRLQICRCCLEPDINILKTDNVHTQNIVLLKQANDTSMDRCDYISKLALAFWILIVDHHCRRIYALIYRQWGRQHSVWAMFEIRLIWECSVHRQIELISSIWFIDLVHKITLNIHSVPMCIYICVQYNIINVLKLSMCNLYSQPMLLCLLT